jgi:phosphoglycerol transferase
MNIYLNSSYHHIFAITKFRSRSFLYLGIVSILLLLILRGSGIYPVVFSDEWSYSSSARLMPLRDAPIPSYLYLYLYGKTSLCGNDFLSCARTLNSAFLVAAIPFIYLTASRVCSAATAAFVSIVTAAGPFNTYAIYFMPETMYFCFFWIFTWFALSYRTSSYIRYGLITGTALGFLCLIKIHALFLIPGFFVYVTYSTYKLDKNNWMGRAISTILIITFSLVTIKLAFGYLFAGQNGLTLFGNLYGAQASGLGGLSRITKLLLDAIGNLKGHLMGLCVIFGMPLAALFMVKGGSAAHHTETQALKIYTICILIPLLIVAGLFTAHVTGAGPYESIGRLHMRYYNFAFPLLLIIGASQLTASGEFNRVRGIYAIFFAVAAAYSTGKLLASFTPGLVDSPELRGFTSDPNYYYSLSIIGVVSTLTWAFRPNWGGRVFVFAFIPLSVMIATSQVSAEVRHRLIPDAYDDAGILTRKYLGSATSRLLIIGPEPAALSRTLFHIDDIKTNILRQAAGDFVDFSKVPTGTEWLLLLGDYELPKARGAKLSFGEFSLVQIAEDRILDFKRPSWPGVVIRARGLARPEAWGSWSTGKEILLEFSDKLPTNFNLLLDGHAFGPNANEIFNISVGAQEHDFRMQSTTSQKISFNFKTNGNEEIVRIRIPNPVSPKSLGLGEDARELGLALSEIRIVKLDEAADSN